MVSEGCCCDEECVARVNILRHAGNRSSAWLGNSKFVGVGVGGGGEG